MDVNGLNDSEFMLTANLSHQRREHFLKMEQEYILKVYGDKYYITNHVLFVIVIVGFITNTLNILVLRKASMSNSLKLFLITLAISDILLISTFFSHLLHYYNGLSLVPYHNWILFNLINWYFLSSFIYISNWLVAVVGIWRCVFITWPTRSKELCNTKRAKISIAFITVVSFVLSATVFTSTKYKLEKVYGEQIYVITAFEINNVIVAMLQIRGLLSTVVLVKATLWIVVKLYLIRRNRKKILHTETNAKSSYRITAMLLILLFFYFLSNVRRSVGYLFLRIEEPDPKSFFKFPSSHILDNIFMLINNSISFFIYFIFSVDFQRAFKQIFCVRNSLENQRTANSGQNIVNDSF